MTLAVKTLMGNIRASNGIVTRENFARPLFPLHGGGETAPFWHGLRGRGERATPVTDRRPCPSGKPRPRLLAAQTCL